MSGKYQPNDYEEVAKALKKIRKQRRKGKSLKWTGPNELHHSISATCPEPSWYFSPEGMEWLKEHGHGFWDVYTQVAFHLGFHNGYLRCEESTSYLHKWYEEWTLEQMQKQAEQP